ncbi:hypothetical protein AX16_004594 [Volvariella volvacea WC 439]|nr:hypothetical protein AX16_004594 [Volvariella volvacea WC 439]
MFSPQLEAKIVQVDTEIAALQAQIVQLRRRRNSLMPISTLPAEIIAKILKLVHDDAMDIMKGVKRENDYVECAYRIHGWIHVTRVYAHWRDIALDCPELWTFIWSTNIKAFDTYLERSRGLPLDLDIWHCKRNHTKMFLHAIPYMDRVRWLRLWPRAIDWDYVGKHKIEAPQLGVLQFPEAMGTHGGLNRADSPIAMPKLRYLEVSGESLSDCIRLLPQHMPTVTDLTLNDFEQTEEWDMLKRCQSVRRLTVNVPDRASVRTMVTTVLPKLSHLRLNSVCWELTQLKAPSIQHIDVQIAVKANKVSECFGHFTELVNSKPLSDPTRGSARPHHLSISCRSGQVAQVEAKDATGNSLITLNAELISSAVATIDTPRIFLERLPRFMESVVMGVRSIDVEGKSGWRQEDLQALFFILQDEPDASFIRLRGIGEFLSFLAFPSFEDHLKFTGKRSTDICACDRCHDMRIYSFEGLKTLILDGIDEKGIQELENAKGWSVFVEWLEERREKGIGLERLMFVRSQVACLDVKTFERITGAVANAVEETYRA